MADHDVRQRFVNTNLPDVSDADIHNEVAAKKNIKPSSVRRLPVKLVVFAVLVVPVVIFLLFMAMAPAASFPVAFSLPSPPALIGVLKPNTHLLQAEKLYEGQILGPESIVYDHGHLYTGTSDGQILHIHKGIITTIARLGKPPCGGYDNEPTCGRPLGMRFDADGYLIVCDAYLGLHKINVAAREVHLLLPSTVNIDGRRLMFLNDLDIGENGHVYMTDSSVYHRRDFMLDLMDGRTTGRLLRYDSVTNSTEVLADGLHFANGVQLSRYEDFVLVSETFRARILRYHLKGLKSGQMEVFTDNLPCLPDNIRRSARGGFWVACGAGRPVVDFLGPRPWLRWIISKLPLSLVMRFVVPSTILLELDASGSVVRSLMDLSGEHIRWSSEIEDDAGTLYIGSFREPYIAKIDTHRLPADEQ